MTLRSHISVTLNQQDQYPDPGTEAAKWDLAITRSYIHTYVYRDMYNVF